MGFITRLLGRQESGLSASSKAVHPATKRQQPSSPASGSFTADCFGGRQGPPAPVKVLQNVAQVEADVESDDEETIYVPRPISAGDRTRNNSSSRRAALDICPAAVQRLADKVMTLEEQHYRTSLDGCTGDGITRLEIEQLYSDLQLLHRGRSSMIYRAREVRTGQRVILKAYDSARLTPTKRQNLDRQIRSLKAALCLLGPQGGAVALERVVENPSGVFLVLQACNGGTLIEAIANSGGKLPERQVAIKIALPLLTALARLHSRGIVHRDIKPEHLMIHNGNLKIGDFGNAGCMFGVALPAVATHVVAAHASEPISDNKQRLQQQRVPVQGQAQQHQQRNSFGKADISANTVSLTVAANGVCLDQSSQLHDGMNFRTGSIEYMAPEMLDKPTTAEVFHLVIGQGIDEDELPAYDQKVDIWSLGVVMYEALTGLQPFLADSAAEMASVIATKLSQRAPAAGGCEQQWPSFIARLPVSADGKDFVTSCLTADPVQRPTAQQLLEHRWLQVMQEQATAVVANRAASRRVSLASRGSYNHNHSNSHALPSPVDTAATTAAMKEQGGAGLARANSSEPLVDQLLSSALRSTPLAGAVPDECRSSLDLDSTSTFSRSQTDISLEVGVRTVYRTNTQRLDLCKPSAPRVHGPT